MKKLLFCIVIFFTTNLFAENIISTKNSASVEIIVSSFGVDGGFFLGLGEDVSEYSALTVFLDVDAKGILDIQISENATDWVSKLITIDPTSRTDSRYIESITAQFCRIKFTDDTDGVTPTFFRLQTIFHRYATNKNFTTSNASISVSQGLDPIRNANDFLLDVARGLDIGKTSHRVTGHNKSIPNGTFADVWSYGATDATINWPDSNEKFRIKAGGNVNDTAAGSGARTVELDFLDATGLEVTEILTTAGASASGLTSVTGRRINHARVKTVGTYMGSNTGDILIENETSGEIVAVISSETGEDASAKFTAPLNQVCYLERVEVGVAVGTNKDADIRMWKSLDTYKTAAPFGPKIRVKNWDNIQEFEPTKFNSLPKFGPLTDVWFEAKGNGAVTEVDIDFDTICIKGDTL